MTASDAPAAHAGTAAVVVRNPCTTDARVLRVARTLNALGYDTTVFAVVSVANEPREEVRDGVRIIRLAPRSPFAVLAARLRRRRPSPTGGPSAAPGSPRPRGVPAAPVGRAGGLLGRMHRWLTTLDYYRRGVAAVRRARPDLVHCNDYNTLWIGALARIGLAAAVVYDSHELWTDRNQRPESRLWLLLCEAALIRRAHAVVTTSPGYADVLAGRYRVRRPAVVRNVPDVARAPLSELRAASDGEVVYVGAVTTNRGLEQAIDSLAHAPGVRLRILGPGRADFRARLHRRASALGVESRVMFVPAVAPAEVVPAAATASAGLALIQPACLSYELSLPNKLFEYLSAGLPILGSDIPVVGRFVEEHGVGVVVPPDDPAAIAAGLRAILEPERNRALRQAVGRAASGVSWQAEARTLTRVYAAARAAAGHQAAARRVSGV